MKEKSAKVRWECEVCGKKFKLMTPKQLEVAKIIHNLASLRHKEYQRLKK